MLQLSNTTFILKMNSFRLIHLQNKIYDTRLLLFLFHYRHTHILDVVFVPVLTSYWKVEIVNDLIDKESEGTQG